MKVTAIKQQARRTDRYSIFVDDKYSFSLSEKALLESKLAGGQELTKGQVREFKKVSVDDKLYNNALRYVALRPRSRWEIESYLQRKDASPALQDTILSKLSIAGFIDDEKFAKAFVADRQLLRPTSKRKLILELRRKRIGDEIIQEAIRKVEPTDELTALEEVVERKRRQVKYQDDIKLMQYLARQGFNYDDIKVVIQRH